jgi:hypothetical protein
MSKPKRVRAILIGMVVLLLLAGIARVWPGPGIGPAGFARIRAGMTRAEVQAAVGMPAGECADHGDGCMAATFIGRWGAESAAEDEAHEYLYSESWIGDSHALAVHYGKDGKVDGCCLAEINPPGRSYLDKAIWQVKRLWREWFP